MSRLFERKLGAFDAAVVLLIVCVVGPFGIERDQEALIVVVDAEVQAGHGAAEG